MNIRRVHKIIKLWLALILIFALVPLAGLAGADAILDEQLILAAERGDLNLAKILLDKGAHVNASDKSGITPLMVASLEGHLEVVRLLLEKGADVNARRDEGWTAVMNAALKGHVAIVQILLEKGADVNAKDGRGMTALMMAALRGQTEVVRILLNNGADANAKNNWGNSALNIASNEGHTEIIELLKPREEMFSNWIIILATLKLVVLVTILVVIARIRHDRRLDQPFFENQKWTLTDAYKVAIPVLLLVYLRLILAPPLTQYANLVFGYICFIWIYGSYHLFIKNVYGINLSMLGFNKAKFVKGRFCMEILRLVLCSCLYSSNPNCPGHP